MDDQQHSLTPAAHDGEHALARMRALLDRPLPPEEIRANTELVAASGETAVARMRSILVFAVGGEHFALEADSTHRVVHASVIRRVPHRTNPVFAGIANVAGELTPVGRLGAALGVDSGPVQSHFIVIGAVRARWAFAADRVDGVRRIDASRCVAPPATVRHAGDGCTQYLAPVQFAEGERLVAVLDAARVAALFARSLA
jgi:chemotaxis signal transduction protein